MSSSRVRRAPFIVIEGLDRSGKSTQASLLLQRLQDNGVSSKLFKFPDRTTTIGKMIDAYLQSKTDLDDHVIHLLFAANRWELASTITQTLSVGTLLLSDRYAFSGVAFSTAKSLLPPPPPSSATPSIYAPPPLSYAWCRTPEVGLPAPDLTIFLDISPEAAKSRGGYGEERYEKEELQKRVREVFKQIGEEINADDTTSASGSAPARRKWVIIDAGRSVDVVAEEIWGAVAPLLEDGTVEEQVGRLWETKV